MVIGGNGVGFVGIWGRYECFCQVGFASCWRGFGLISAERDGYYAGALVGGLWGIEFVRCFWGFGLICGCLAPPFGQPLVGYLPLVDSAERDGYCAGASIERLSCRGGVFSVVLWRRRRR